MSEGNEDFHDTLVKALEPLNISLSSQRLALLRKHFDAVVSANRTVNLTRITNPAEAAVKHYADSLSLIAWARGCGMKPGKLLDIGTGAGYPGIPLAIAESGWQITAIDSTRKKVDFLIRSVEELELSNVELHHAHSAHWQSDRRFGLVVLKAFGSLSKCLEQSARFLGANGRIVVYKTASLPHEERAAALSLCKRLALFAEDPFAYRLSIRDGTIDRLLCIYRRIR